MEFSKKKRHTNSLFVTVFNCGPNQPQPFCINIDAPKDSVTGGLIDLAKEINLIISENKEILTMSKGLTHFRNVSQKQQYYLQRQSIDHRLKVI